MSFIKPEEQLKQIIAGTVDIISEDSLLEKLQHSFKTNTPLRVKAGFDPSRPDLHLGHVILLNKLKTFQKLGHDVLFLIGDWTAQIGDPSGHNQTRPTLHIDEVKQNAKTYSQQVFKILSKQKTQIHFNSNWMNKMSAQKLIQLAEQTTVARMLERDDFSKRFQNKDSISIHEFLYPLIQGYDSVVLKADIEIGAVDQIFNLLVGRDLQKKFNYSPQCVLTLPLLTGTDGVKKMSKSYNNFISLTDPPKEVFGKTMKINDPQMLHWYQLLTPKTKKEIQQLQKGLKSRTLHPKKLKIELATWLTTYLHSSTEAQKAKEEFEQVFSKKELPKDIPEQMIAPHSELWICHFLQKLKLTPSTSSARRLIEGGGLEINGKKIKDPHLKLNLKPKDQLTLKAGKRNFIKIKISN